MDEINSAKLLLQRAPADGYLTEWTELLKREKSSARTLPESSVVIFRLFEEWLAINTSFFVEVASLRKIHRIPHSDHSVVLGLVNLRGQLKLTIALHHLLQVNTASKGDEKGHKRLIALRKDEDQWIFPVNEVYGIHHFDANQLQNVPITVAKSSSNYLKGMIPWNDRSVGLIDEELLFSSLGRISL